MKNIIVFGANGYIGLHLLKKLTSYDVKIYAFDIQEKSLLKGSNYYSVDITKDFSNEIKQIVSNSDYIFFFSGITGTMQSIEKSSDFVKVNELGLLNLLNFIKSINRKPKIIFPSTRLVYKGKKDILLSEDDEKEFKTVYAVNKFACEQFLKIYNSIYGINYLILRICVPYGNLLDINLSFGTINHFIKNASSGKNIILFGDGLIKRTFTHIDDLSNIILMAGFNAETDNRTFNIGSNDHLTLKEVAEHIAEKYKVEVEHVDFPESDSKIESGDTIFNGDKLLNLLNYKSQNSFNEWLTKSNLNK